MIKIIKSIPAIDDLSVMPLLTSFNSARFVASAILLPDRVVSVNLMDCETINFPKRVGQGYITKNQKAKIEI